MESSKTSVASLKGTGGSYRKRKRGQAEEDEDNEDDATYTLLRDGGGIADWDDYLSDLTATSWVCPVNFFQNAPMSKDWDKFATEKIGTKIELKHPRSIGEMPVYCVATIVAFAGYKCLVRFENNSNGPSLFGWISYCSDIPKPLGYSAINNHVILPVEDIDVALVDPVKNLEFIDRIYSDVDISCFKAHLKMVRRNLVQNQQKKFHINQIVEVMDREDPVRNRFGVVTLIVGDRVQIRYMGERETDPGICCSIFSDLVHPIGWSHAVGQELKKANLSKISLPKTFNKKSFPPVPETVSIQCGMMFEVRHPISPYKIATGTVMKKLKYGYFKLKIQTTNPDDYVECVYHITSENILPCGFSKRNNIPLHQPPGEDGDFSWAEYFVKVGGRPLLTENPFQTRPHKFVKGSKLEAVDVCEPAYLGPATVVNVAEHLLYIHFDGWPRNKAESHQWVSAFSYDIYPAGWAEMVGHRFQGHVDRPRPYDSYYIARNYNPAELAKP